MKNLNNLVIGLSGTNIETLHKCHDQQPDVYLRLGYMVLITAIFGGLSGGYAVFTITQNSFISLVLGSFWGFCVLSMDRFCLASMTQRGHILKFFAVIPRLIFALVMALVITIPLTLAIFKSEIKEKMADDSMKSNELIIAKYDTVYTDLSHKIEILLSLKNAELSKAKEEFRSRGEVLSDKISKISQSLSLPIDVLEELRKQEEAVKKAQQIYFDERKGKDTPFTTGIEGIKGVGSQIALETLKDAKNDYSSSKELLYSTFEKKQSSRMVELAYLKEQLDRIPGELNKTLEDIHKTFALRISTIQDRINQNKRKKEEELHSVYTNKSFGLLAQLRVLNFLLEQDLILKKVCLLISLLFMSIEILPIVGKFLIPKQIYNTVCQGYSESA